MWLRVALAACCAVLGACQPSIGDECQSSADCSQGGERLCDITQPGGYCTVFGCEPGTCPEDSTCVAFGAELSTIEGCEDRNGLSRFARTFCMAECESSDDCRSGYDCLDVGAADNVWGAVVIDTEDSGMVCIVAPLTSPLPDRANEVCTGSTADGTGTGGSSGEPGSGGSSGGPGSGGSSGGPGGAGSSGSPGSAGSSGGPGSAGSSGDEG